MKKIYILALVFALATGALFYSYVKSLDKDTGIQYEQVVAAACDIPAYTPITADMVKLVNVEMGTAHSQAARTIAAVTGKMSENALISGEQLYTSKLKMTGNADDGLAFAIPEGMRAITVPVGEVTGVAWFLRKGDIVDVLADMIVSEEYTDASGQTTMRDKSVTLLIADAREIAAVGTSLVTSADGSEAGTQYNSVTLFVTPQKAQELSYALNKGTIRLVLRTVSDHSDLELDPLYSVGQN
jgi:pilus assembly protein CpaB